MAATVAFEDSDHELVVGQFEEFADGTITARKLWEKCRNYRDGNQYTETERAKIEARGQPVITDNKIQDKCDTLMGIEKQMRTDPKAQPRNPSDEDMQSAEAATDALRYIADTSDYKIKARKGAADNLMVEGVCYGQVIVSKEYGKTNVCMERIRQDRGYYDIRSLEDDFRDKRYCGYFTWMDDDAVVEEFTAKDMSAKDIREILDTSDDSGWTDTQSHDDKPRYILSQRKRKRVQVFNHWHMKAGKWHESVWCRGGFLVKPKSCTYKDEHGKPECPMEIQALYRDSDGNPYGSVPRYLDLQDEHNKRRSKMLHLLTAKRLIIQPENVPSPEMGGINKLRTEMHKPDGVLEVPNIEGIKIEDNLAEAEGQWRLLQQTDMALSATGPNAALAGVSGDLSGIAKARDQQAGQLPISPLFDALDAWEMRMYRQAWARVRQFWKAETWIRVTDNEDSPRWVGLNQPVTNGEQLVQQLKKDPAFQQLPDEQKLAQIEQIAADASARQQAVKDGKLLKRNVPGEIDVDIIIDRAPDVATLQQEEFGTLAELAKTRPEVSFKTLVKLSGIRQTLKREVLDELKQGTNPAAVQQAMQQVQQQSEMLQQAQTEIQKQTQEVDTAKAELQAEQAQIEAGKAEIQTEIAKLNAAKAEFKAYVAEQKAGLAMDKVGFQGKQLDAKAQQMEASKVEAETEKVDTEALTQQIGESLSALQEQINTLAQAQMAVQQQANRPPPQIRVKRGPKGISAEQVEQDENGAEVVKRTINLARGKDGYDVTVQ